MQALFYTNPGSQNGPLNSPLQSYTDPVQMTNLRPEGELASFKYPIRKYHLKQGNMELTTLDRET